MKCSRDAERSVSAKARRLAKDLYGVMGALSVTHDDHRLPREPLRELSARYERGGTHDPAQVEALQ